MRILHICETATGGVGTYLRNLHQNPPDGVENEFLAPDKLSRDLPDDMKLHSYRSTKRGLATIWSMIRASRRTVKNSAPDIVFFHSTFSLAALAALRMTGWRGKAIYCAHGWAVSRYDDIQSPKARLVRLVEKHASSLADKCLSVSKLDLELAQKLGYRGQHICIENAVPPSRETPRLEGAADGELSLLFVGRLDRQKGIDVLLDAIDRVADQRQDIALTIVGEAVRQDNSITCKSKKVHFVGWKGPDELDALYASADAVIVPSRWEGLPLVIPEAYRNGTPVLVSDRGALPSLVKAGESGAVFPLSKTALAEFLLGLDKRKLADMRQGAFASYTERFTVDLWRQRLRALYTDVKVGQHRL